jgi:hypothetical protein
MMYFFLVEGKSDKSERFIFWPTTAHNILAAGRPWGGHPSFLVLLRRGVVVIAVAYGILVEVPLWSALQDDDDDDDDDDDQHRVRKQDEGHYLLVK